MKRMILWILIPALCLTLLGCGQEKPSFQQPVELYYRTVTPENGIQSTVIDTVTVEGAGQTDDLVALLNNYLLGTTEPGFESTFPIGAKILDVTIFDGTAHLRMNTALGRLTGVDLTIACACLTLTAIDLTGVNRVRISAGGASLDGAESIVMDKSCLTLLDTYIPETR